MENKLKYRILLIAFFSYVQVGVCYAQKNTNDSSRCIQLLEGYAEYWQKDSIGDNGFRQLAIKNLKLSCKLKGQPWNKYRSYFGKPNKEDHSGTGSSYTYNLTNYVHDKLSNRYLEIEVDSTGKITMFLDWTPG
jgi:hypothetical protein